MKIHTCKEGQTMGQKCIGIDIGGTTVKLGIFTAEGELLKKWEVFTRTDDGGNIFSSSFNSLMISLMIFF